MSWICRSRADQASAPERSRIVGEAFLAMALAAALGLLLCKTIAQAAGYHAFHDDRALLGIPNILNVSSNLPFVVIGLMGLKWLMGTGCCLPPPLWRAYAVMMTGTLLTGFGSAWYHYASSNASLVWDRLPMAVAFMGLYAAIIGERVSLWAAKLILAPLVGFGIASVLYWQAYDDLRPYLMTQCFPLVTIPLLLAWLQPTYSRGQRCRSGTWAVCCGESIRVDRWRGLRPRTCRKRPHAQTPCRRRWRLCAPVHAATSSPDPRLRFEFGVPIQVIHPAFVQIVGREHAAVAM